MQVKEILFCLLTDYLAENFIKFRICTECFENNSEEPEFMTEIQNITADKHEKKNKNYQIHNTE